MSKRMRGPVSTVLLAVSMIASGILVPESAVGQVTIAPPLVIMDGANRVSHYLVQNTSGVAQEVSVSFRFGYPRTNEDGETTMEYDDEAAAARHSITDQVRAFPRQFVLQPGQRQRVRVMLAGDRDFEDGAYWTRIVTSAAPVSPPVDTLDAAEGITTQITVRMNTVTSLLYRRGDARTGLEMEGLHASVANGELVVRSDIRRTGNTPFLGRRTLTLRNAGGEVVHESGSNVAVYFDQHRRFNSRLPDLEPGTYTVELSFEARRSDVPSASLLPIEPVSVSTQVVIPGG